MKKVLLIILVVITATIFITKPWYMVYDLSIESSIVYALEDSGTFDGSNSPSGINPDFEGVYTLEEVIPTVITSIDNEYNLSDTVEYPIFDSNRRAAINSNLTGEQLNYLNRDFDYDEYERLLNVPLEYTISPEGMVRDGEQVTVTFSYDEELAKENKIKFKNLENTYTIDLTYQDKYIPVTKEDVTEEFLYDLPYYETHQGLQVNDLDSHESTLKTIDTEMIVYYLFLPGLVDVVYQCTDGVIAVYTYSINNYDGYMTFRQSILEMGYYATPEEYIELFTQMFNKSPTIIQPDQVKLMETVEYNKSIQALKDEEEQDVKQ